MAITDIDLDANDEFYLFDEENGGIFSDDDRLMFCEGYRRGAEAMRAQVLTMLEKERNRGV
jgi:hypothetical protein